ncbi:MAG TPA: CBS domain-containing protein [Bryobacteraceae bacterium]|nr:CBS domain-containing protein [Bryobacteraceae bacterium]
MRVKDVMRKSPKSCGPGTNLAAATELLWSCGCGALPVTDGSGRVLGIITDRDICVALGTRNLRPSELKAEQVMSRPVATCGAGDDVHAALEIMRTRRVRRIPAVGDGGKLEGVLCLSDLVLQSRHDDGCRPDLSYDDVMGVLKSIYWQHLPAMTAEG